MQDYSILADEYSCSLGLILCPKKAFGFQTKSERCSPMPIIWFLCNLEAVNMKWTSWCFKSSKLHQDFWCNFFWFMSSLSLPDGCASIGKCCKPHSLNVFKAVSSVSLDSGWMFSMVALTYPSIQGGICFHCGVQINKGHRMDTALQLMMNWWSRTSQSDTC